MADAKTEMDKQLAAARQVMARRKPALEQLAQTDAAEQIMKEHRAILRKLAKS